jgi:hypothetical protein
MMFEIFDFGVKLEQLPSWVWAFVLLALFLFGAIFAVPEARQAAGCLVSNASLRSGLTWPSIVDGLEACRGGVFIRWEPRMCGRLAVSCKFKSWAEAEAACGKDNVYFDTWPGNDLHIIGLCSYSRPKISN